MQICWSCRGGINTPVEKDYAVLWLDRNGRLSITFLCKECYDKPEFEDLDISLKVLTPKLGDSR